MTEQQQANGVLITLKDVWIEVARLGTTLSSLEPVIKEIAKDQQDHEKRIRRLERLVWAIPSSLIMSGAAVAVAYFETHK